MAAPRRENPTPSISPLNRLRPIRASAQGGRELVKHALAAVLLDHDERLPIDARRAAVPFDALPRLLEDVIPPDPIHQGVKAPLRRSLGCDPESPLQLLHFVDGPVPTGGIRTGLAGHALARTCADDVTTPGVLPSRRVVRRDDPRYYDPLGRPLRTTRFRRRLIRAALPRLGPRRRASRVPFVSLHTCCAPYPAETCRVCISGPRRGRRGLRRGVIGSALGL